MVMFIETLRVCIAQNGTCPFQAVESLIVLPSTWPSERLTFMVSMALKIILGRMQNDLFGQHGECSRKTVVYSPISGLFFFSILRH